MLRWVVLFVVSVLGAHALAYWLVTALPDPSLVLLGFFSGNEAALDVARSRTALPPYGSVVAGLFSGDLGQTLDNIPVIVELSNAGAHSVPRILAVLAIVTLIARHAGFRGETDGVRGARIAEFLVFVPAFVFPLTVFGALQGSMVLFGRSLDIGALAQLGCVATASIGPAALTYLQSRRVMSILLDSQYAQHLRSLGADHAEIRSHVARNYYAELLPSFAKILVSGLGFLVFAEYIFDLPGLGKLTMLAITRSDLPMILGIVIAFSLIVNAGNIVAAAMQRRLIEY